MAKRKEIRKEKYYPVALVTACNGSPTNFLKRAVLMDLFGGE